jgi:uncharacterized protein with FMN-binding domain
MRILILLVMLSLFYGCASEEMRRVRTMDIKNINLEGIDDGDYIGSFSYGGFDYRVKTVVNAHRIIDIKILQNRKTKQARQAEAVLQEIVKMQTPNVDVISGATTTSKALMKAVENSLTKR